MADEIKTVRACLMIQVEMQCPYCDADINLLDSDTTNGYDHNEEGAVISQACGPGNWCELHEQFNVPAVECIECKKTFNVMGLDW